MRPHRAGARRGDPAFRLAAGQSRQRPSPTDFSSALWLAMQRLAGLDALRGVAALCVLTMHVAPHALPLGNLAVDLFFVLSGFVMARTYEERLRTTLGPAAFAWLRYRRLFAALALGCAISALAHLWYGKPLEVVLVWLVPILLFLPGPGPNGNLYALNGPAWSLSFELFANIVHAFGLARLPTRALAALAGGLMAVFAWQSAQRGGVVAGTMVDLLVPAGIRCLGSYCVGILLYRLRAYRPDWPPLIAVTALPVLLFVAGLLPAGPASVAFVVLACPMLVWTASAGSIPWPRFWLFLGAMSYPLYATHGPLMAAFAQIRPILMVLPALALAAGFAIVERRVLRGRASRESADSLQPNRVVHLEGTQ